MSPHIMYKFTITQLQNATRFLTSVMSSVHPSVVVTHGVEVIQIVEGEGHVRGLVVLACRLLPRRGPGSQIQVPHALASLHHMGGHVQPSQGETHQGGQLIPPLSYLFQHY